MQEEEENKGSEKGLWRNLKRKTQKSYDRGKTQETEERRTKVEENLRCESLNRPRRLSMSEIKDKEQ